MARFGDMVEYSQDSVTDWIIGHPLPIPFLPRRLRRLGCQAPQHKFLATPMDWISIGMKPGLNLH